MPAQIGEVPALLIRATNTRPMAIRTICTRSHIGWARYAPRIEVNPLVGEVNPYQPIQNSGIGVKWANLGCATNTDADGAATGWRVLPHRIRPGSAIQANVGTLNSTAGAT